MVVVSAFDSECVPAPDAPCDPGKDRAYLAFPYRQEKLNQETENCEWAFSRNWRGHSDRLSFANGFRNDRVAGAHY